MHDPNEHAEVLRQDGEAEQPHVHEERHDRDDDVVVAALELHRLGVDLRHLHVSAPSAAAIGEVELQAKPDR